jgi:hypothetical protein
VVERVTGWEFAGGAGVKSGLGVGFARDRTDRENGEGWVFKTLSQIFRFFENFLVGCHLSYII